MDLRDAAAYHMLVINEEGASRATQKHYLFYWNLLIDGLEASHLPLSLDALNTNNVRAVINWYRGRVNQNSSRQGDQSVRTFAMRCKTFARFLEREEIIPDDTLRRLRAPRVSKVLREPFSDVELNAMWGACHQSKTPARDEALFLLLLSTGMRIGEAATLNLDKLRIDQRQAIVGQHGKGRRERIVPLGSLDKRDGGRVLRALRVYLAVRPVPPARDSGRVFLTRQGRILSAQAASRIIQHLGEMAGVVNPIPHRLRHTYCTDYLTEYPNDSIGLREVVGHLSKDVLADYVHLTNSTIASRAGRVSIVDRLLGTGTARSPSPAARQTTVGVPTPNEQPRRVAEPQPRSGRKTASTIEKPESKRNDPDTFNVAKYPRKALRYFPPGTPYAF